MLAPPFYFRGIDMEVFVKRSVTGTPYSVANRTVTTGLTFVIAAGLNSNTVGNAKGITVCKALDVSGDNAIELITNNNYVAA